MPDPQPMVIELTLEQKFTQAKFESQIKNLEPKDFEQLKEIVVCLHYQMLMKDALYLSMMNGGF